MVKPVPPPAGRFSKRLCEHPANQLEAFAEIELMSGLPFIFACDEDMARFQEHVANALGVPDAAPDVFIVGSAKMGFSLSPDSYFEPFREMSDIDIAVVHEGLFDETWRTMLAWDYLTIRNRTRPEQQWLYRRQAEVWSGFHYPPDWNLRERNGLELSFPESLKPLRDFAFRWFSAFRSLSRYRDHQEIPRHRIHARLYRKRAHVAMYHAMGLRALRRKLLSAE